MGWNNDKIVSQLIRIRAKRMIDEEDDVALIAAINALSSPDDASLQAAVEETEGDSGYAARSADSQSVGHGTETIPEIIEWLDERGAAGREDYGNIAARLEAAYTVPAAVEEIEASKLEHTSDDARQRSSIGYALRQRSSIGYNSGLSKALSILKKHGLVPEN